MSSPTITESLEYLERTARRLRLGEHPNPERVLYLMALHLENVNRLNRRDAD